MSDYALLRLDTLVLYRFNNLDELHNTIRDLTAANIAVVALKYNYLGKCYAVQEMKLL